MTGIGFSIDGYLGADRKGTRGNQATAREKTGNGESEEIEGAARDGYLLFPIREPRRIESKSDGVGVGTQPLDFSDISM